MPYKYIEETSSNELLVDEDVDIDAMETPMETKSTANWWENQRTEAIAEDGYLDTHNLSRGIPALEEIAAKDHSDYDTWKVPSQSTKNRADFFCGVPAERNTICTVSGTWNAYTQLLRSEPVVSRKT